MFTKFLFLQQMQNFTSKFLVFLHNVLRSYKTYVRCSWLVGVASLAYERELLKPPRAKDLAQAIYQGTYKRIVF